MQLHALERWSRGASAIHRLDPRAKAGVLLVFLVVLATAHRGLSMLAVWLLILLGLVTLAAGLPLGKVLLRSGSVLIFTVTIALAVWLAGDPDRAVALLLKSYLSGLAVLVVLATTPIQGLLHGLALCGVPYFLLLVMQFLYRYLFVIVDQAVHMRTAILARGGDLGFRGAGAAVAALFAGSHTRAQEIHRAMMARGFTAQFPTLDMPRFAARDGAFLLGASTVLILVRASVERWTASH